MKKKFLLLDIGGTWIKSAAVSLEEFSSFKSSHNSLHLGTLILKVEKIKSPLKKEISVGEFIQAVDLLISKIIDNRKEISGIGISTTGIVNYHGTRIEKAPEKHNILKQSEWIKQLENFYRCPVVIINDTDAATIGMAELNYMKGNITIGVMCIGTGLGFSVWRNGRRWRPGKKLPLLGSIYTKQGSYNDLASASRLAGFDKNSDLGKVLTDSVFEKQRQDYFECLAGIITTATILYGLDEVFISGGLVDSALRSNFDLNKYLLPYFEKIPPELDSPVKIRIIREGNLLQLYGALSLIIGESVAHKDSRIPEYSNIKTEIPFDKNLMLHRMRASEIVRVLLDAENDAAGFLLDGTDIIAEIAVRVSESINKGGRLIYVGSGTSGRIAAIDAVEIPCTFGLSQDRVITLIAGGISDASLEIESEFEEDASSIPEVLLLNITPDDVVIGISASGSAYFVQSALAVARYRGAYTVMVQSSLPEKQLKFCDSVIPLNSGYEVLAGSTRLKAATATKKVLNCLSTTAMIMNGYVAGSYMTGVACYNNKLVKRAQSILSNLYNIPIEESDKLLAENQFNIKEVLKKIEKQ